MLQTSQHLATPAARTKLIGDGTQLAALIASKPLPTRPWLMHAELSEIPTAPARRRSRFDPRVPRYWGGKRPPYQPSPDRAKSLERRRDWAWRTNAMPSWLVKLLARSECARALANLFRQDHERQGYSGRCHDEAAAIVGCCAKTVQRVQHWMETELGLISVDRRKQPGRRKHLPNIIRIISPEWLDWIARDPRKALPEVEPQKTTIIETGHACPATKVDKKEESVCKFSANFPAPKWQPNKEGDGKESRDRGFLRAKPPPAAGRG